jgi:uncharacterized protein YlxW (UPF0749 family)
MDEAGRNDLRRELSVLQAEEERLSAERDRLHHQIDFGFESSTTREREREVSAARRDLHQRIALVRKVLGATPVD